jgi:hypothetical protein
MYLNIHIWAALCQFVNIMLQNWYQWERVVFEGEPVSALVAAVYLADMEVHMFVCVSSMSADSLSCHFGKEGIQPCGIDKAYLVVVLLQSLSGYERYNQLPSSWHFGTSHNVSWLDNVLPPLQPITTVVWPFWLYYRTGACSTFSTSLDLLPSP